MDQRSPSLRKTQMTISWQVSGPPMTIPGHSLLFGHDVGHARKIGVAMMR
jgi:hypothetical protein